MIPQISVIIPVYNIEKHLRSCLDSVRNQTLGNIEIICIDDGSTDSSLNILKEYAALDSRFNILHQKNQGPGSARNCGLMQAMGDYLIFLDSDDYFSPDMLEKLFNSAVESEADVTICRSISFDTNTGKTLSSDWMRKDLLLPAQTFSPGEIAVHIFQFTYGWPWDKLYRTSFIKEFNLKFPNLPNSEDLVFVFPSLALAKNISTISDILVYHRMNRASSVSNSRCLAPEVPYQALYEFKYLLIRHEIFERYERSFLKWAMEFLIWNVSNMGDAAAQKIYFYKLKKEWLPQFNFSEHSLKYYGNGWLFFKYFLVNHLPYQVFNLVVNIYHHIKQFI